MLYRVADLDNRICDVEENAENTQTYREWIHDICVYIYGEEIYTNGQLNELSDEELTDIIEELDWLADKQEEV